MQPSTMNQRPNRAGISLVETISVLAVIVLILSLLFPAINGSREKARANQCRGNLRRLSRATWDYVEAQRRLPAPSQWPHELYKWLGEDTMEGKNVFQMERPNYFVCPSHPEAFDEPKDPTPCLYVLIYQVPSTSKPEGVTWTFRDRERDIPAVKRGFGWFTGPVMTTAEARLQLKKRGPHANHAFQQIEDVFDRAKADIPEPVVLDQVKNRQ